MPLRGPLSIVTFVGLVWGPLVLGCSSTNATGGAGAPPPCGNVQTGSGPVQATPEDGTSPLTPCSYMGIPYAAAPTGALRWKPPQPAMGWSDPRPSQPGSTCPQYAQPFGIGIASNDEDCLFVNVWVPSPAPAKPAPVMVFVHGGGFVFGAGTVALFDGTNLAAATGSVVVTFNYRLGPFGFLSNAPLRAEDPAHPSAGNYGIEDQIAALQWVKANIGAFGGDAANVTLFGESAGGMSVFLHLLSPKTQGLFARVIAESGWVPYGQGAVTTSAADAAGAKLATALGCTDPSSLLSCLRGKAVPDVLAAVATYDGGTGDPNGADWLPVVDGFVLPDMPMKLFSAGSFAKVPTILGNNKNEGTLQLYTNPNVPASDATYQSFEEAQYPGHGAAIAAQYPITSFNGSYQAAAAEALGDGTFVCPARRIARALTNSGAPTFRYDFTHAVQAPVPNLGAFHGSELLFVFGNGLGPVELQQNELPLSQAFMGYWGSMAAVSDPNGDGRSSWPAYDTTSESQIVLDLTISTESAYKKAKCDFWDGILR